MITHAGNICVVGRTCLTWSSIDDARLLHSIGMTLRRQSCYVDCKIEEWPQYYTALQVAGVDVDFFPSYATENSESKWKEWKQVFHDIPPFQPRTYK